ncbi:Uncharacterized protein HZ326_11394 [Fusarium oxysporum f. sp. albedinis]|nr:Uncharacterized protein HZ326_11394 [Fusarium oxysporum f. sp. albedinis]
MQYHPESVLIGEVHDKWLIVALSEGGGLLVGTIPPSLSSRFSYFILLILHPLIRYSTSNLESKAITITSTISSL